jgi:nitrate/TMAO reductase-like tetraheme cytochrome c subunit
VFVTTSTVFWIYLLPTTFGGELSNPYLGILGFLVLPAIFFLGLALIPLGIWWKLRRERERGSYPADFPPLTLRNPDFRRLIVFVAAATFVNIVIGSQLTYGALHYMDSVSFCGQTCHTVMQPEFVAYQNSPHSRVECVKCHIGPGASWFVRSKLSGVGQVFAVAFNTYPRPIPTPVHNLRPARDTCEGCHWPQKYGADRLRVISNYAEDEANSATKTVLLIKIGGAGSGGVGIHGFHMREGVKFEYAHSDEKRQTIPWVRYTGADGKAVEYFAPGVTPEQVKNLPVRLMDCMDCHTRPSHSFDIPERAVNTAIARGDIPAALPFAKKHSLELLKKGYSSREQAAAEIPKQFASIYREQHAEVYGQRRAEVEAAARGVLAIWNRNVFPGMNVTWGVYPNNIGHTDFPGCFRCHDDSHATSDGARKIGQDCNTCHNLLAMDESDPKILTELGVK